MWCTDVPTHAIGYATLQKGSTMPRWNLHVRDQTPRSKLVELEPQGEGRGLTPAEIQEARLELSAEMLALILRDGATLSAPVKMTLQGMGQNLLALRRQLRTLP
jgi:hypothetical protein